MLSGLVRAARYRGTLRLGELHSVGSIVAIVAATAGRCRHCCGVTVVVIRASARVAESGMAARTVFNQGGRRYFIFVHECTKNNSNNDVWCVCRGRHAFALRSAEVARLPALFLHVLFFTEPGNLLWGFQPARAHFGLFV